MGLYDAMKDAINLAQKADNIELYRQLLDLSAQALELQAEVARLKEENAELRKLAEKQNAELEKYRQPATFSRDKLSKESKRISETENLKSKLRKATAFIDAYGLSEEFKRFTYNKLRNTEIE